MSFLLLFIVLGAALIPPPKVLRILTWEGYINDVDVDRVNRLLEESGYNYSIKVISPFAENPEQMFNLIRNQKVDIAFLTLFFINLQGERTSKLLKSIDVNSPRLTNYKYLLPELTHNPMGMINDKPLYIPFVGGCYGFYANKKFVNKKEMPSSWSDLLKERWKGKYCLTRSQPYYNVAIASILAGKSPFYLNSLAQDGNRDLVKQEIRRGGVLYNNLRLLYKNSAYFWDSTPIMTPSLEIVSSWGTEITKGLFDKNDWFFINFKEGNLVWLDTINFIEHLNGRDLEAAELVANYFIGREVQSRLSADYSLVSVSKLAKTNPILEKNPNFFSNGTLVPAYNIIADNAITSLSEEVLMDIGVE